jgi:3-hydroxy-9,10-secoandrosta-1,3,5(10)-triene-9,17-dione monooxygenase reductase component
MTVVPLELRKALSHFVTGVTIVTTRCPDGTPQGITANSFTSVSLEPPLISVNLSRSLASFKHFRNCSAFAVHLLSEAQQDVSARFASRGADKWEDIDILEGHLGVPLLPRRLGLFECSFYAAYAGGDHEILVGKVEHFDVTTDLAPLAFFKGAYRTISENAVAVRSFG